MTIHWGLEAHIERIPRLIYDELVASSIPGPNNNPTKAKKLRNYRVPACFSDPDSNADKKEQTIRIHAAIVGNKHAWIIIDNSRIV